MNNKINFMFKYTEKEHIEHLDESIANAETSMNKIVIKVITGYNQTYNSYSCCKTCYEDLNGIEMDLELYKENPILPYRKCTRENEKPLSEIKFCNCVFGFAAKRDKNGKIIKK